MGCGKSCIGETLCRRLGRSLIDLDSHIEETAGRSISAIFKDEGEAGFRLREASALTQVLEENRDRDIVLALGGGTLTIPEAAEEIRERTVCVYLRAGIDTLVHNLTLWPGDRPMLNEQTGTEALRRRITELMQQRKAVYESTAHIIIDIDGMEYDAIAEEIIRKTASI